MSPHTSKLIRGAAALFGFALLLAPAPASAQTWVEFGDEITEPGVYFLHGNQSGSGVGIRISSDDVALFLGRFTLSGDTTDAGIISEGSSNVLIWGGRVTNFRIGISMDNSERVTVKDIRIDRCLQHGLLVVDTVESSFLRMRTDHNRDNGVEGRDVDNCRFLSILAHDNGGNGILLRTNTPLLAEALGDSPNSKYNKVKLCWAAYNRLDGIRLWDADDNEVERNQCVNNGYAGILLGSMSGDMDGVVVSPGSQRNHLRSNWCVANDEGIRVEWSSSSNTMTNNTALANSEHDMVDRNFEVPCVNTWFLNFFLTKDGDGEDCIF